MARSRARSSLPCGEREDRRGERSDPLERVVHRGGDGLLVVLGRLRGPREPVESREPLVGNKPIQGLARLGSPSKTFAEPSHE